MPAAAYQLMRVYDYLEAPDPAFAILLDRLWPRGIAKEKLAGVLWEKDATPSAALRAWVHADSEERYPEFCTRFAFELQAPLAQAALTRIRAVKKTQGSIQLLTAAKDPAHSHLAVLQQALSAS